MRFVFASLIAAAMFGAASPARAVVQIHVDLTSQFMHVSSAKGDYDWAVSTGRPGFRTPTGDYRPQRMFVMTHSNEYDDAPMPHAIFFSGGYAIHGTYATGALGRVASHGCIRLAPGHAAALFEMVKREGAAIVIDGTAPGRDDAVEPDSPRSRKLDAEAALAFAPLKRRLGRASGYRPDQPLENQ